MAIDSEYSQKKNGDFPVRYVSLPGRVHPVITTAGHKGNPLSNSSWKSGVMWELASAVSGASTSIQYKRSQRGIKG